jgi:chemotaxis protein histidine kinase CheA
VDRIKQMLDTIAELSDDQVAELKDSIIVEFETVEGQDPTPQTVDTMTELADMLDTVRAEAQRRAAQAEELAARAAEAAMRVKGEAGDDMAEDMDMEEAPEAEEEETPEAEEEEDMAPMAEASTNVEEASELSTAQEVEASAEAETAVEEETVVAAIETIEEAPVEETVAEASVEIEEAATEFSTETTVEVEAEAEASTTEQETTIALEEQEGQEATVTAAANEEGAMGEVDVQAPADRRPIKEEAAPVVITAGADIPGYTAGAAMADFDEIAEAMVSRLHGLRRVKGGDGEQHIVASVTTKYPESRVLTQDTDSNVSKIKAVASPEAIVASGGHSAPFEVRYDIFGFGTTERPIRDSLPRFAADRGGVRYILPPVLSDYGSAVGVWTNATDTNPGTETKASLTVSAATETTVATDAVTLQLQFGNLMTRAYPELVARHNELALIQHAREAEQYLISKFSAASTAVTSTSLIGFARDFLVQVGRAASAYRNRHRLDPEMPLRAIAPSWVKDAMAADLTLSMPGDSTLNAYGEIDGYLAARGVNITYSPDMTVASAQSGGAMNEFADSFDWYLFAEGTFLFLDGGTLDLGIIRDSTLVGTNDYKMFVETFEGVAKVGIESIKVTSTINVNGVAAALRDTTGGASAAVIEY